MICQFFHKSTRNFLALYAMLIRHNMPSNVSNVFCNSFYGILKLMIDKRDRLLSLYQSTQYLTLDGGAPSQI